MTMISGIPVDGTDPVTLHLDGDRIVEVQPGGNAGAVLSPGLVDLHCHGGGGHEFGGGDDSAAVRAHAAAGTTTVVASLVTATPADLQTRVDRLARLVSDGLLAGIHLEGPFLAPTRCGAHDPTLLRSPDIDLVADLCDRARGAVTMITVAPELPGADALFERLPDLGVRVALGHTDATAATMGRALARAAERGPTPVITHLFNAMPPLHHREPGPVAPALVAAAAGNAWVEVIADGVHLADETVTMTFALVGDRVLLVSDATAATFRGDGHHHVGGLAVTVDGRESRQDTTGGIAGSVTPLLDAVRTAIDAGVPRPAAFAAATRHPARVLGRPDLGHLRPGARADVLELTPDLALTAVWRGGQRLAGPDHHPDSP